MLEKKLYASWGDMDFNSHMRNTACLEEIWDAYLIIGEGCESGIVSRIIR